MAPELQEKARACGSIDELLALANEAKVPLPDEALAAIAGGDDPETEGCKDPIKCPKCGSTNVDVKIHGGLFADCYCQNCGYEWSL